MPNDSPTNVEEGFAQRLAFACGNNPHVPTYGRGEWIRNNLEEHLGKKLSAESISNWFAGEARPRPNKMRALARILRVDEAWLSLGAVSDLSPGREADRSSHAGGAVNFVAAMIQLGGGAIAFVEPHSAESAYADFFAIVKGKAHLIKVSFGVPADSQIKFAVPNEFERIRVIALVKERADKFQLYEIPSQIVSRHGEAQDGHVTVVASRNNGSLRVNKTELPGITDFESYQL